MKSKKFNPTALIWLFVLMMTTIFFSCEKEKYPPEYCRKDPNCEYFVCKVNGERWGAQCNSEPLFGCSAWDVLYGGGVKAMDMYIDNEVLNSRITMIVRKEWLKIGNNKLYTDEFIQTFYADGSQECNIFTLDTIVPYSFYLSKIDTINYCLSGTFFFTGKNDCGDEVKITDGEFNLPYRF